jgi:hypothetical protein
MDATIEALPLSWLCMAKDRKPFLPIGASTRRAVVVPARARGVEVVGAGRFLPEALTAFFAGEDFLPFFVDASLEDFVVIWFSGLL